MLAACGSAMALGQITADGIVDPTYGVPLAIQGVETAYGDSGSGNVLSASGSELSAGYATIRNNTLYVMLAGNLSSNSSRLNVLLDVRTGGQNPLRGDNPITEMDALNRLGSDAINPGMSFFEDIAPDFWVGITTDDSSARVEFVELSGDLTSGAYYDLGFSPNGGNGVLSPGLLPYDFRCVINNSNTAGVAGGTGCAVGGQTALAGVELAIPLAVFNLPAIDVTSINVIAFVGGAANETVSNQCLPTFDCPAGGGDEPRMLQMPAAMPANGMPAMPAARPAGPWFERWRAGGPNDQSAAGLMAPHSGLAATPAAAKFEDRDLAGWAAGLIGCTEFVWAFGQCFSGGFIDELHALGGVHSITTASRHAERSWYEKQPPAGNGKDWVLAYIDAIGVGGNTAIMMATTAAANDPHGPNPAPAPARGNGVPANPPAAAIPGEVRGIEHPQYHMTAGAANNLKLTEMVGGVQRGRGYAIVYVGDPEINMAAAAAGNLETGDRKFAGDAVNKLIAIGYKRNQIYVFYGSGKVGGAHPLVPHVNNPVNAADVITLRSATKANVAGLFNTFALGRKPDFIFWISADHGWNSAIAGGNAVAPGGGGGGGGQADPDAGPGQPHGGGDSPSFPTPMSAYGCDGGCPADFNGDGHIGLTDLSMILGSFGACFDDAPFNANADMDMNGCVSLSDLASFLSQFGAVCE